MNIGDIPLAYLLKTADVGAVRAGLAGAPATPHTGSGRPLPMTFERSAPVPHTGSGRPLPNVGATPHLVTGRPAPLGVNNVPSGTFDPIAVANRARQVAQTSGFRGPIGTSPFTDAAAAQRFISRNPMFSAQARTQLGQGPLRGPAGTPAPPVRFGS